LRTENEPYASASVGKLAALVDYQDGAVVSRTLIDKKAGTVTLFSFDGGQGLSEHTAPFDALVYAVEGEAEIAIAGEAHGLRAGELIIMPAHKPHAIRAARRFKMLLVLVRD
jgi:quercetin dioxygenase-like cupin family protein